MVDDVLLKGKWYEGEMTEQSSSFMSDEREAAPTGSPLPLSPPSFIYNY